MRILIVEDEKKTAAYLAKGLHEHGFIVDVANDGKEGLFHINNFQYDLVILDVMLPEIDGWTLIKILRNVQPNVRVLFLTARDEVEDKVRGLESGADDYLVKPFSFSELLARIRTLLRRRVVVQSDKICVDDLVIDLLKHKVSRGLMNIDLTAKEFSLLTFLAQNSGKVLSRTLIAEQVWDVNFDSETNVIDVAIRRLRRKVDDGFERKLIHTMRGVGYVLEDKH